MKIGIYSDVHASQSSSIMPIYCGDSKYSTRLKMIVDSFKWMYNEFEKEGVEFIFNLGDLFDSHTVSSYELTAISEAYSYSKGIREIHITGNHEVLDKERNFYSTALLSQFDFISLYHDPTVIKLPNDVDIALLPHMNSKYITNDLLNSLKSSKTLMSHIDILGSHIRPDYTLESGVNPELLASYFNIVFNGHLHTRERIDNSLKSMILNVGSFSSNSFSDSNSYIPGITIFDTKSLEIKHIDNPHSILFRKFKCNDISDLNKYLSNLDKKYRYIIRARVPYRFKDKAREIVGNDKNVIAFRIVSDVSDSSKLSSVTKVEISNDKDIGDSFLEFISDNPNLIKYPYSLYESLIKEIR